MKTSEDVLMPSRAREDDATVTVIVPAYNAVDYVAEAMRSVLVQSYPKFVLHVHDDGSKDSTLSSILDVARSDERCRVSASSNRGLAATRNAMVDSVETDFVALMDADDRSTRGWLEFCLSFLRKNPDIDFVSSGMKFIGPNAPSPGPRQRSATPGQVAARLLTSNPINGPTVVGRTDAFKKWRFDPEVGMAEDLELWCRMVAGGVRMQAVQEPLYEYRVHSSNSIWLRSDELSNNVRAINARYRSEMLGTEGLAGELSAWLGWCARERFRGIRDIGLMDSSIAVALRDHREELQECRIPVDAVESVIREEIINQFVPFPSLASASSIAKLGPIIGAKAMLVGFKRGIQSLSDWRLRSGARSIDWEHAPLGE